MPIKIVMETSAADQNLGKKFSHSIKNVIILCLFVTLTALVILKNDNIHLKNAETVNLLSGPSRKGVVKTSGVQSVKPGCVNIYGSDFVKFPNTDVLVICENTQLSSAQLDKLGFAPSDANHGMTYVETGFGASIILFLGEDFTGESIRIPPGILVSLDNMINSGTGSTKDWNDKALSAVVVCDANDIGALGKRAFSFKISKIQNLFPIPSCAILYGSNPTLELETSGVVACAGSKTDTATFTKKALQNLDIELKRYDGGISYARVGSQVSLTLYTGADPDHSAQKLNIAPGTDMDLTKIPIKKSKGISKLTWDNYPVSFEISTK